MRSFLLLLLPLLVAACVSGRGGTPSLTDPELAAVMRAANDADIAYARVALGRSADSAVRLFARRVQADHEGVNRALGEIAAQRGWEETATTMSLDTRDEAETVRERLLQLPAAAFDTAYAANEIDYHAKKLQALDAALLPAAKDARLRDLLLAMRAAVAAHLEHARRLRDRLAR